MTLNGYMEYFRDNGVRLPNQRAANRIATLLSPVELAELDQYGHCWVRRATGEAFLYPPHENYYALICAPGPRLYGGCFHFSGCPDLDPQIPFFDLYLAAILFFRTEYAVRADIRLICRPDYASAWLRRENLPPAPAKEQT